MRANHDYENPRVRLSPLVLNSIQTVLERPPGLCSEHADGQSSAASDAGATT